MKINGLMIHLLAKASKASVPSKCEHTLLHTSSNELLYVSFGFLLCVFAPTDADSCQDHNGNFECNKCRNYPGLKCISSVLILIMVTCRLLSYTTGRDISLSEN